MGSVAFRRSGALFRLCETIWEISNHRRALACGLRAQGRPFEVSLFLEAPFRLGMSGGFDAAISTISRSAILPGRNHGYPRCLCRSRCPRRRLQGLRTYVGRSRFRGPYAPRRHSPRHAKFSISWRDRFYRFPVEVYRVRPLRPVRPSPARDGTPDVVQTRLQVRFFRVGTVATGTASAFDRSFAPRYGSDLLTLRLLSLCSWVTWIYTPPN